MSSVNLRKMHTLSIIWGALLILIVMGLTVFGFYYKHVTKVYRDFEIELANKTKEYLLNQSYVYEDTARYSMDELIQNHVIENNKVNDKDCNGYVEVEYLDGHHEYTTYLKCGMYKTRGYKEI